MALATTEREQLVSLKVLVNKVIKPALFFTGSELNR